MASAKPIDRMRVEAAALVNVSLFPCPSRCVTFSRQYTDRLAHHVQVVRTHAHTCSQTIALCCLAAHSKHTLGRRGTNKLQSLPSDALAPHVSTFSSPFLLSSSVFVQWNASRKRLQATSCCVWHCNLPSASMHVMCKTHADVTV